MKKVLVIGGTRFFGKKAVNLLLEKGHDVTIATRGKTAHPFGDRVNHVILDVQEANHSGWTDVTNQEWDAVFDNICYTKEEAEILIDKFANLTNHVYFTSTMSVYSGDKDGYAETDFNPFAYLIDPKVEVDYGEGKRQAEAVLFNQDHFKVTSFRFPIVLDTDDYTERLHFYVGKAIKGETIHLSKPDVKVNFVKGSTAAEFIVWTIENEIDGIYNIASKDAVEINTLMSWLEEELETTVDVVYAEDDDGYSPFSTSHDQYLISDKIINAGFDVTNLEDWLKPLIKEIGTEMRS